MSKAPLIIVDKIYKLTNNAVPISFTLPSRNTRRFPLLWFDEENNENRSLRYATNQKSPFEDEQDGNALLEPIIFDNGFLMVPKNNPALQKFLHYHPLNGRSFIEINKEKDAEEIVTELNIEADAMIEARQLSTDQLETVYRVLFGKNPTTTTTAELKRDIMIFAKRDPKQFLNMVGDPELKFNSKVHIFFENKLLALRNNNKEVWFTTPTNKKKMMSIPFGEEPHVSVGHYLKSDDGLDSLKMLEACL